MHVVIKAPALPRGGAARVRRMYEAWNERNWDAVEALLEPEIQWFHAGRHELVKGKDAVLSMLRSQAEAFPHALIDVRTLREAEDVVVVEWTVRHARASGSTEVDKPAIVCEVLQLRNGLISSATTYGDIVTMLMEFRDDWRPPLRAVC